MWTPTTRAQHSRAGLRYGSDVTDAEWQILSPFLPPPSSCGCPRKWEMREIVNAIFYVLRGGIAWSLLPKDFPPWSTTYRWFARLRDDGIWERINHHLVMLDRERVGRDASPTAAVIDNLQRLSIAFGNGTFASFARASRRPRAVASAATTPARRSKAASATPWWIRTAER